MKFIFSILLFLLSFNLKAQYNTQSIIINSPNYNNWYQCEESGRGKASFFAAVSTSNVMAKDGYYYYDVFFYNNSFYRNGIECSTYIKNINYYIWNGDSWQKVYYQPYALVKQSGQFHAAYVYSFTKIYKIKIVWQDVLTY